MPAAYYVPSVGLEGSGPGGVRSASAWDQATKWEQGYC